MDNLFREGVANEKVHLVGNVMIDTLLRNRVKADASRILEELHVRPQEYALLTLHRPSNVDNSSVFGRLLDAFEVIARELPIVFPIHPRTRKALESSPLGKRVIEMKQLRMIDPAGYLDFIKLMSHSRVVLTDSGGIQEETTILHVPCLTLRDNTERPITIECGTNQLVGTQPDAILKAFRGVINAVLCEPKTPPLWDGRAAQRIVDILLCTL